MRRQEFNFIIEKLNSRLARWKDRLLNKLGHIVLANSVLSSLPTYTMQSLWLPKSICENIDSTVHNFIRKERSNSTKGWSLVNWDIITLPKKGSGLGVCRTVGVTFPCLGSLFGIF